MRMIANKKIQGTKSSTWDQILSGSLRTRIDFLSHYFWGFLLTPVD